MLTSFVKIDVEGGELGVVRGAIKSLTNSKIESLMIEANKDRCLAFGYQFEDCIEFIESCDFRFNYYRILKDRLGLQKMNHRSDYIDGDNILILHEESEMMQRVICEINLAR
jgi:hypothetical protein